MLSGKRQAAAGIFRLPAAAFDRLVDAQKLVSFLAIAFALKAKVNVTLSIA
jgi:hypothetical protein